MLTPFLFEMRTVIDWMFTETTLVFSEWFRVESIYAQVYQIKCKRVDAEHESPRGKRIAHFRKWLIGGGLTFFLIAILWLPLILFALSPALGEPNIPREVSVSFQIGSYEPLFKAEASKSKINPFTEKDWKKILKLYEKNPTASLFLEDYEAGDVVAVNFGTNSSSSWNASPPNAEKMINDIKSGELKSCRLTYKVSRPAYGKSAPEITQDSTEIWLDDQNIRDDLVAMLNNPEGANPILLRYIFPKIINARNNGKISSIPQLYSSPNENKNRDLTLQLFRKNGNSWWELKEICEDKQYREFFQKFPRQNCQEFLTIFVFNDKSLPSQLGQLLVRG